MCHFHYIHQWRFLNNTAVSRALPEKYIHNRRETQLILIEKLLFYNETTIEK